MPRRYSESEQNMISKLIAYFTKERDAGKPLLALTAVLALGVNKIFDMGIELSGIAYNGDKWSKVTDVFQKSFIEITEWGIVGTSFVKVIVTIDSPPDIPSKTFKANHPFLFKIVVDDMVIFAGHVVNP